MFPISDDNPRIYPPYATITLIVLNLAAWLLVQGLGNDQALARFILFYLLCGLSAAGVLLVLPFRLPLRSNRP